MEVKKIVLADTLIVIMVAYLYISEKQATFTIFQNLLSSVGVGIIFLVLMNIKYIAGILQFLCSIFWLLLLFAIVPLEEWVGGNKQWVYGIGVLMFIVFMNMHGFSLISILERRQKKKERKEDRIEQEKANEIIGTYMEAHNEYLRVYKLCEMYQEITGKNELQCEFGEVFVEIAKEISLYDIALNSGKFISSEDYGKLLVEAYKIKDISEKILERYNEEVEKGHNRQHNTYQETHGTEESSKDIDVTLFSGCTNKESLTKRYRHLMKTFHPDNANGDQEMTQKIQRTYENLCKQYKDE